MMRRLGLAKLAQIFEMKSKLEKFFAVLFFYTVQIELKLYV